MGVRSGVILFIEYCAGPSYCINIALYCSLSPSYLMGLHEVLLLTRLSLPFLASLGISTSQLWTFTKKCNNIIYTSHVTSEPPETLYSISHVLGYFS